MDRSELGLAAGKQERQGKTAKMVRRDVYRAVAVIGAATLGSCGGVFGFVQPLPLMARTSAPARTRAFVRVRMSATETEKAQYTLDNKAIGGPLTPIASSILVRVRAKDQTTLGGVILPDKIQEKPTEGEVVGMGPGRAHPESGVPIPLPCSIGDKVLYGKYDGTAVSYMGKDHQFVRDDNILFVYSGEKMELDTIKMIRDEILVKVDPEATTTKSGIVLGKKEDDSGAGSTTGEVVAVGPGRTSADGKVVPMTIEKGDLIKFRSFSGSEVSMQGLEYRVMKVAEILAKW